MRRPSRRDLGLGDRTRLDAYTKNHMIHPQRRFLKPSRTRLLPSLVISILRKDDIGYQDDSFFYTVTFDRDLDLDRDLPRL